jgi:hypothetical protein
MYKKPQALVASRIHLNLQHYDASCCCQRSKFWILGLDFADLLANSVETVQITKFSLYLNLLNFSKFRRIMKPWLL